MSSQWSGSRNGGATSGARRPRPGRQKGAGGGSGGGNVSRATAASFYELSFPAALDGFPPWAALGMFALPADGVVGCGGCGSPLPPAGSGAACGCGGAAADARADAEAAAATTDLLLDALAPGPANAASGKHEAFRAQGVSSKHKLLEWPYMEERPTNGQEDGFFGAKLFLGDWVDSLGAVVRVVHDAEAAGTCRLVATLLRAGRREIQLHIRPVTFGAGWQCGHSILDPLYSTPEQLHWVTVDGKLSVWVPAAAGCYAAVAAMAPAVGEVDLSDEEAPSDAA